MPGLFRQRTVQRNHIAAPKQFFQRNRFKSRIFDRIRVIGQHLHAKPLTDSCKYLPDFPGSNYPHRLSMQIKSNQSIQRKIEVSGTEICLVNLSVQCQQQSHRMFCNCIRGISWNPQHGNSPLCCGSVYMIESCTPQGNHRYVLSAERIDYGCIQGIVDKRHHGLTAGSQRNRIHG